MTQNEAWYCTSCRRLIYNLDEKGYPSPGAPVPMYVDEIHNRVCSLCFDMFQALQFANKCSQIKFWDAPIKSKALVLRADPVHEHC